MDHVPFVTLKQNAELFRLLVLSVRDYAIFALDPDGRIISWNPGAERLKGYKEEEIVGKHFSIFYPKAVAESGHPEYELQQAIAEGHYEEVGWRIRKDGSQFWASVTITPLKDEEGNLRGFAKVTRDLTERKMAEENLKSAYEQAVKANHLKSQFLANISHEVRTPLSGIVGLLEILRFNPSIAGEDRQNLEVIFQSSTRLLTVLDELLDFSKIEAGRLLLNEKLFSLRLLVDEVVTLIRAKAESKGLLVEIDIDSTIPDSLLGDCDKIIHVLLNLAHNSVKFTEAGRVKISIEKVAESNEQMEICINVEDTGIGISPEAQEQLFQPYIQADGTITRRFGGTGLGLSISKRLVDIMKGKISVESIPGQGSIFSFSVPLRQASS